MNQMDHILHNFAHFVELSKVFTIQQSFHNSAKFSQFSKGGTILHILHKSACFAKCCTFYTSKERS